MKKIQLLFAITILIIISSCSSDDSPTPVTNVLTLTTATPIYFPGIVKLGGEVTNDGGKTVTERGVCIGDALNPVITNTENLTEMIGNGLGVFTLDFDITTALAGGIYHYRAYAKNADGTAYGEDKIITIPAACPTITAPTSITTPTTWTTGNVYMVTNLAISSVLTIQPGVIIKMNGGSIDINGSGKIIANGTATNRIVFTSFADDSYCGDSNGDGIATSPQKGDWQLLYLNGGTNNLFNYCDFFYGGANRAGRNSVVEVTIAGPSFTFDNCKFAHTLSSNSTVAYAFFTQNYMSDNSVSVFTNNAFYDNDRPISLSIRYTLNTNNIFHDPSNPSIKNTRNGVYMNAGTTSFGSGISASWSITEVPYVVDGFLQANSGSSLNIGANVVVKFTTSSAGIQTNNTVNLNGTAFLTSYKDDVHGGDTNGDANASIPLDGDWLGYYNQATASYIQSANVLYAAN